MEKEIEQEKQFREERYQQLKEEGKKEAAEYSKKAQKEIDRLEAEREEDNKERAERSRRKDNPTPEEQVADREAIDKERDKMFRGWTGYIPEYEARAPERPQCPKDKAAISNAEDYRDLSDINRAANPNLNSHCKADAAIILNVDRKSACSEIRKKYHKVSQVVHPDKNLTQKELAGQAFASVRAAYETLCHSAG
jgi:hypothetical protein